MAMTSTPSLLRLQTLFLVQDIPSSVFDFVETLKVVNTTTYKDRELKGTLL